MSFLNVSRLVIRKCRSWKSFKVRLTAIFLTALLLSLNLPAVWAQASGDPSILVQSVLTQSVLAQSDPAELVNQAQIDYEQGHYLQSVELLRRAVDDFDTPERDLQRAIALSNLSLTYQSLRDWDNAQSTIEESLRILGFDIETSAVGANLEVQQLSLLAPVLETYGQLWQIRGDSARSLEIWQQASALYEEASQGRLNNQINQLQALQSLGLYQQAATLAKGLTATFQGLPISVMKTRGLRSFGEALRHIGELKASEEQLRAGLLVAQQLAVAERGPEVSAMLLSLGHTQKALGDREKERRLVRDRQGTLPWQCLPTSQALPATALQFYQQAEDAYLALESLASADLTHLSAGLNHLAVLIEKNEVGANAQRLWREIDRQLQELSPSRSTVYAQIRLAKQGSCLKQLANNDALDWWEDITRLLKSATENARLLQDSPAESYALGNLAGLYELFGSLSGSVDAAPEAREKAAAEVWETTAQTLTQQALLLAQATEHPEIAYQWYWQLARLAKSQGNPQSAADLYRQSIRTLEAVRSNLLTIDTDVQFSFRDNVEPVYREFADILLQEANPIDENLKAALRLIDTLQLTELENFLRCNLAGTFELSQTKTDDASAIFYTILLSDRLEVIVQLPDQTLRHHSVAVPRAEIVTKLDKLAQNLQKTFLSDETDRLSLELYQRLIQPEEAALASQPIDTLVFVLDGSLRNVPIAALQTAPYDAEKNEEPTYLIEQYAVALAPRLQLQAPQPFDASDQQALFFGLSQVSSEFQAEFGPLPGVIQESQNLQAQLPSQLILNENFTDEVLAQEIQETPFSILHFATHGEFSSEPENTYILAWDQRIKSNELRDLIRQRIRRDSIELLILSACKTADGDHRATLGIAGLSLQAGAESTVASLWVVDDQATVQFMDKFYQALSDKANPVSRAEALRQTQLAMIREGRYRVPTYWAPFILVGNWL